MGRGRIRLGDLFGPVGKGLAGIALTGAGMTVAMRHPLVGLPIAAAGLVLAVTESPKIRQASSAIFEPISQALR